MTLKEAERILLEAGINDPRSEARRIFSLIGGYKSHELLSPSLSSGKAEIADAISRRANREPLQYIIGEAGFYRESYKVTPDTLIPREDTELLVDFAVKNLKTGARFLDLCTGSGCIALSVLNNTINTTAYAVDISDGALSVARENAERLGLAKRVTLKKGDARERIDGDFFAILSNPPYVSDSAYRELEREIYFEPKVAFLGGEDGGDFYRAITPLYRDIIPEDGFIAYEIGYDQGGLLREIARTNKMSADILTDLSGNDRVAVLRRITE